MHDRNALLTVLVLALALPASAGAAEQVLQVRTAEDAAVTADPAVCARAGFTSNLMLGASVYGYELRQHTGEVKRHTRKIGTATACAQITSLSFPAGLAQNFYVEFDLPEGHFAARGTCTIISNNVPQQGLVIAGCALGLVNPPAGYLGGAVTSTTTFNPFRLAGFATGSYWTLQLYRPDPALGSDDDD